MTEKKEIENDVDDCDTEEQPSKDLKLERVFSYYEKKLVEYKSPDIPKHICTECGMFFICSIVCNKICKCTKRVITEFDINQVEVKTPQYFCDLVCYSRFVKNNQNDFEFGL